MTHQKQTLKKLMQDVHKELLEMKRLGMDVPTKALKMAQDKDEMNDYSDMSVSECADLLCDLARI